MIATNQLTRTPSQPTTERVQETLHDLRRGNVRHGAIFSILTAAAILLVLMILAISLDWYFGWLSNVTRWVISLASWLVAALTLAAMVVWILRTRRFTDELAEQADGAAPVFEERLQTIVSVQSDRFSVDQEMMDQVLSETEVIYQRVEPSDLVQRHRLRIPLAVIATGGLLLLGMFVAETRSTGVLVSRFLWPSTNLTRTVVDAEFSSQVVGRDEPWTLSGTLQGPSLETVALEQRLGPTETVHRVLNVSGSAQDEFQFTLSRAKQSFDYRVTAGDFRSKWVPVTVANRPRIISAQLRIVPPAYTGRKETHLTKIPKKLTVLTGSKVMLALRAEGNVDRAEWILNPDQGTRSMYAEDGHLHCNIRIDQTVSLSPRLVEPNGLENRNRFEINIRAVEDKPPTVKITRPSPDAAVRPDDTIRIEFEAIDDVGVKRADLVVYKKDQQTGKMIELKKVAIPIDPKQNKRRVRSGADIDLSELDLEHGETISYRVDVYDQKQLGTSDDAPAQSQEVSKQAKPAANPTADQNNLDSKDAENTKAASSSDANAESQRKQSSENDAKDQTKSNNAQSQNQPASKSTPKSSPKAAADSQDNPSQQTAENTPGQVTEQSEPSAEKSKPQDESQDPRSEDLNDSNDQGEMKVDATEPKAAPDPEDHPPSSDGSPPSDLPSDRSNDSPSQPDSEQGTHQSTSPNRRESDPQPSEQTSETKTSSNSSSSEPSDQKPSQDQLSQNQQSQSSSTSSKPSKPNDSNQQTPELGPRPTMRELDAAKEPSSSPKMDLKIDQFAGSFNGQARRKLEIAIEPILKNLKKWLIATDQLLGSVQFAAEASAKWNEGKQQSLSRAIAYLDQSMTGIDELVSRTNGTPYAFVGLQISDIALTHLDPAHSDAAAALKTTEGRDTLIDHSRIQVQRALARLDELSEEYQRSKRDQLLAERIAEYEKVYRIYIEDVLTKLQAQRNRINSINRKAIDFELDEEYLQRLQEVLEMKRDLEAELARILSEDPRLLKRFSQASRENADNLRDQFTVLARRQVTLAQIGTKIASGTKTSDGIEMRTLEVAYRITRRLGDSADRFDTWMPLNEVEPTPAVTKTLEGFRVALSRAQRFRQSVLQQAQTLNDGDPDYVACQRTAEEFIQTLGDLRQQLIALGVNSNDDEIIANAVNRLNEISQLRASMLGWRFQINALAEGRKSEALAVDQHQLMTELHEYADKMSTLPRQVARILPDPDALPENIANLAEQLLSKIDTAIEPTQLAAVLALRKEDHAKAQQRMTSAAEQFNEAEKIFDQLMIAIVEVLDELPVNDPIASLLNEPTLEEILADLERELPLNELLGIPNRPSNLRIISDWKNNQGKGNSGSNNGSSMAKMLKKMMEAEKKKRPEDLKKLRQHLVRERPKDKLNSEPLDGRGRWSKVISQLQDGLIQQRAGGVPEQYRSAIQQYFETISSK